MTTKGPGLYEFLTEAELQQYFNAFKKELKVHNVGQLKFVTDEDMSALGMSKPEVRRLKKYFLRYFPQTYISKLKKIIKPKKEGTESSDIICNDDDRPIVRVPSKHIIPADAIVINKELGVGEFGVVQQGVWTNEEGDRIQVAIKCLSKERMESNPQDFLKEANIMHSIDSEHIVRLYGVVFDTSSLLLVTELAPLRSLLECLKEPSLRVSLPVVSLCHFSVQICDGMSYLESRRFIHRDLAARNVLVFSKNKVKISDFGLSRALGVGKDYYQTNFNVNLKLPIAWCAPECINYLKFTCASDVWAFGVTLWEMFSYGFQPWAALTGQQILEAIDEPNFQRLEQPEACPKEFYNLMLKCWQHEPVKRPRFADMLNTLPEMKPDQVQAVRETKDFVIQNSIKRDKLPYNVGDIITVLDKRPATTDSPVLWKGVLNNGKSGWFDPAYTVAYLGTNVPSTKTFPRGDGKNAYSSRRRLRPEMISVPQGDFKHTGHVGLDGAYFGDVSFLGEKVDRNQKYQKLPKQIVTPFKPFDDQSTLSRASSDVSDRAPLLKKVSSKNPLKIQLKNKRKQVGDKGNVGPANDQNWSDSTSEERPDSPLENAVSVNSLISNDKQNDHEYHEISDQDEPFEMKKEFHCFTTNTFDMGPSLMDEVFKALGTSSAPSSLLEPVISHEQDEQNLKNEIRELSSRIKENQKKKHAIVKPISATDEKTLDSAIAMANELASKSMQELDSRIDGESSPDSPLTPTKLSKFSFKLSKSPKMERRQFSVEANSIQDIQSSITEEAKEVYNVLIDRPAQSNGVEESNNPLRMLRKGMTVRPKVRGNKHNSSTNVRINRDSNGLGFDPVTHSTLPRGFKHPKIPPPVKPKPNTIVNDDKSDKGEEDKSDDDSNNPLPLPPRDRSKNQFSKPRHQRKYPLIIPSVTNSILRTNISNNIDKDNQSPRLLIQHTHNPLLESKSTNGDSKISLDTESDPLGVPPEKPPRLYNNSTSLDDSFESQVAYEMEALDDIPSSGNTSPIGPNPVFEPQNNFDPVTPVRSLYQSADHVSCEDLLEFALDKPNSKRTQGPAHGIQSDEVHLLMKVMKYEVTENECLETLNECGWNVHRAVKLLQLSPLLKTLNLNYSSAKQTLDRFSWDVAKSSSYLAARSMSIEDVKQV